MRSKSEAIMPVEYVLDKTCDLFKRYLRIVKLFLRNWLATNRRRKKLRAFSDKPLRLHVGCGPVVMSEWVNLDIDGRPDIFVDLTRRLPFGDGSVGFVFSEHVIEHLSLAEASYSMKEFARVLAKDGVIRIATVDLDQVISKYHGDWADQRWLSTDGQNIHTRAQMLNAIFYQWGHKFIYNEEELRFLLQSSKFTLIARKTWGNSDLPILCNLERREDSKLIIEARKG
jgi:predicted SAM-dependent methyltransferase